MIQRTDLPDPDNFSDADVVIFDGHCNFCRSQINTLRRFDCCGNRIAFLSLHDARTAERYPDLTHDMLMEQMYVIDQRGNRHGGSDGVRYLTRRLPTLWLAAPLLHLPGTAKLWRWMYQQVAKRRYKMAGKSCDDACNIHLN